MTVPDFDYTARPQQKLEIPLAERIAAIRKMKSEQRARSAMKNARTHGPKAGSAHGAQASGHRPAPRARRRTGRATARPRDPAVRVHGGRGRGPEPRRPIVGEAGANQ